MRSVNHSDIDIDGTVTKFFLKYHEQTLGEKVQQELLEVIKKSEIDIVVKDTDESTTMEKMAQKFFDRENFSGNRGQPKCFDSSNEMVIENISTLESCEDTKHKTEEILQFYRILIAIIGALIFFTGALLFAMLMSYLFDPPKVRKVTVNNLS
jgi:nitrogen regulatory protein PII